MHKLMGIRLGVGAIIGMLLVSAVPVSAGCWDCELSPGAGAALCKGVGYGEYGSLNCTPEWLNDDFYCKFDGGFGPCESSQPHCPGCLRYPALTEGKHLPSITTQVIVYDLEGATADVHSIPVRNSLGLRPDEIARELRSAAGKDLPLIGYSVQSSRRWTSTRYRGADGHGVVLLVTPAGGSFTLRTIDDSPSSTSRSAQRTHLATDEAAVLHVELNGRQCLAVVHTMLTPERGDNFEFILTNLHDAFAAAVQNHAGNNLANLQVDAVRATEVGVDSWAMRGLADAALAVGLREYR